MDRILRIAATSAALALAAPVAAQQSTTTQAKVGIGVGMPTNQIGSFVNALNTGATRVLEGPQIFVPINVSPNLRIEPQFGYLANTDDELDETDSSFTLGAGVLYVMPVAQQTNLYAGGRLWLNWAKDESHPGGPLGTTLVKTTQRSTGIAPVLGGEYVPSPRFSVGAEAQLDFISLGDPKVEAAGFATQTFQGGSTRSTQALVFVRVYFM